MMLIQKAKSRCTELEKEIEEFKSKCVAGGTDDIIKALTERLDAVLLEKAEAEQQCVSLKKENIKMKEEVEQLEAATNEKEQEITYLKGVIEANSQQYQKDINSLQEELLRLKCTHQEEVKELMCQIEASAKEREAGVNNLNQLKENLVKQCEAEDSFVEQEVNEKVKHLEDALRELESQHSILKDELEDSNKRFCCAIEQHNKEVQSLQEQHQKEISELNETLLSELGESAGKISQEFESMKQQQASDVNELQQKLRTAFNEKDALLETVNHLQRENENLNQRDTMLQE
ncbi:hypothetical protein CB1_000274010, partial [Camelus ferus]